MLSRFWSDSLWLPENTTWEDISNGRGKTIVYAEANDFWVLVPLVAFGLTLRFLSERYVFSPLGRYLKISVYKVKAPANTKLEAAYRTSSSCKNASSLAKQLDLSQRQIERWWRLRQKQDKPTTLAKFCETVWKGINYFCNVLFGVYVVWGQDWAWDVDKCFDGYPHQGITLGIWWLYMLATSYYLSLIITQFRDVRRKDFWQMVVHHIMTIYLLYCSWVTQTFRFGCLVLILHDMGDIVLEFGKAAKYAKFRRVVDIMFAFFLCVWVVTRLVLIPIYVFPIGFKYILISPVFFSMIILLMLLFALSLFWTWLIFKVLRRVLTGGLLNDVRSSDSEEDDVSTSPHSAPEEIPRKNLTVLTASQKITS